MTKKCNTCRKEKGLTEFHCNPTTRDKHSGKCIVCTLLYVKKRYAQNSKKLQAYVNQRHRNLLLQGKCVSCGKGVIAPDSAQYCKTCRERKRITRRRRYDQLRLEAFAHYGGAICKCCGEKETRFLTLDHINGGGNKHRKEMTSYMYKWIQKKGYPDGLQVLCWNCNLGRYYNDGICPHKGEKAKHELS